MKTKKFLRNLLLTVGVLVAAAVVVALGFWLIDGSSPQAYIVSKMLPQTTMEVYEMAKAENADKSVVEIPEEVEFPREVTQFKVGSMQVFEVAAEDDSKPIVLYIHGGAYVNNFALYHWKAMAEWAERTGCGIVTPNYPMLFRYTVKDAFPLMLELYRRMQERYGASRIIVMGDSAGGGFSLTLAQQTVVLDSLEVPSRLILISPWVDVVGGDDALQKYDSFLNLKVLRVVGADWAADWDVHDQRVSPLYGDMQGLPPTDLYAGTWETLYTDVMNTYEKMKQAGVDARMHVKKKMGHVYPIWPCPEGSAARKEIAGIIAGR